MWPVFRNSSATSISPCPASLGVSNCCVTGRVSLRYPTGSIGADAPQSVAKRSFPLGFGQNHYYSPEELLQTHSSATHPGPMMRPNHCRLHKQSATATDRWGLSLWAASAQKEARALSARAGLEELVMNADSLHHFRSSTQAFNFAPIMVPCRRPDLSISPLELDSFASTNDRPRPRLASEALPSSCELRLKIPLVVETAS